MRLQAFLDLGWSPLLAVASDGSRRVLSVAGWEGGSGDAPASGLYVGSNGYVTNITDGVDIRGGSGAAGANFAANFSGGNSVGNTFIASTGTLAFYGGNNITLSLDSVNQKVSISAGNGSVGSLSAGTTNLALGQVVFSNSNGVSFGLNGSTVTATVKTDYQTSGAYLTTAMLSNAATISNINLSAGTTSNNLSAFVFSNSNGLAFGLNGSTITGSYTQAAQTVDTNKAGTGFTSTGNNIGISGTLNTNGLSLSATVPSQSNQNISLFGLGNTTQNSSTVLNASNLSFNAIGSITMGFSNGSIQVSAPNAITTARASTDAIGLNSALTANGVSMTANSSGLSLNFPAFLTTAQPVGAYLTTAMQSNAATISNVNISAGTTSGNLSNFVFSNSNGVSFGLNGSTVTATVATNYQSQGAYLTTAALSQDSSKYAGLGTTFAGVNLSASMTLNTNGLNLSMSAAAPGGGGAINVSAGTTSGNLQTIVFSNSNGVSFGLNGSTVTATVATNYLTTAMQSNAATISNVNISAGTTSGNLSNFVFSNSNGVSFGLNGSTVTATVDDRINISAGTTSGLLTDFVFSNSNRVSFGLNGSTITAQHALNFSAGTTSNNVSDGIVFSNSNGVSFGLNGSTITANAGGVTLSSYEPYPAQGLSTVFVGLPTATSAAISLYPLTIDENVSAGIMNLVASMAFLTVGNSSGRQSGGMAIGLFSRNVSTLSSIASTSWSWGVTANNSSYTINQPTSTAYSGYGANADTNSAGSNITSGYTGMKLLGFPINTLLTQGQYWLGIIGTNSTSSINAGISISLMGAAMATALSALAPMGSFSSAFTAGQDPRGGRWNVGQGSWTSVGSLTNMVASINMTSISAVGLTYPLIKFWST